MTFYCYILFSPKLNKYYIGHTGEVLTERIRKHNSDHAGFTGGLGDWQLKWKEAWDTKEGAYKRERQIKRWKSKKMIESLPAQNNLFSPTGKYASHFSNTTVSGFAPRSTSISWILFTKGSGPHT